MTCVGTTQVTYSRLGYLNSVCSGAAMDTDMEIQPGTCEDSKGAGTLQYFCTVPPEATGLDMKKYAKYASYFEMDRENCSVGAKDSEVYSLLDTCVNGYKQECRGGGTELWQVEYENKTSASKCATSISEKLIASTTYDLGSAVGCKGGHRLVSCQEPAVGGASLARVAFAALFMSLLLF